jgi:hypothetical protein
VVSQRILFLREYLATSEIDLLMAYTEFRASPAGSDISLEGFMRLPLKLIYEIIRLAGDRDKRIANIYSISTARLAGIIISIAKSFGGNKGTETPIDELLPFPLNEEANKNLLETKEIMKKLIARRKLPISVIAALNKVITT